jgi:pullulanase
MNPLSLKKENAQLKYDAYTTAPEADLWTSYSSEETVFKLWSPVAEEVILKLYEKGDGGPGLGTHHLQKEEQGLWVAKLTRNLQGSYYTFQLKVNGVWLEETPGIYAQAVGVNGKRAMVLDLASTNPPDWEKDKGPVLNSPNDAILYELHIRDLTRHPNAGSSMPGNYLGLTEEGTINKEGLSSGFDHIKELGVTHVHLLPAFDHRSIDEAALHRPQYNWGYDPQNYNVPEGSYSSDPFRAEVRIREFKQMVKSFHDKGIGVVLDVVYNHTGLTENANFNLEVPGYYYRHTKDGKWSNASGCGNETASERSMMRKFIIESCTYWVREYHLDGFRFDLMGIHDIETMNLLAAELRKINPSILLYGEGWTAGPSPLPDSRKALKANTHQLKGIAAFSDDLRDGLKGSVFEEKSTGFVSGAADMEESVKFGVTGCTNHPQLDFHKVNYSSAPWAKEPWQSVSYVSCHDNQTLYDKLKASCKGATEEEIKKMHLLANAVILTAQGIPFLHAGVEMMRTKRGEHNTYNLPDEINQIDWHWKTEHKDVFEYYKKLIHLRKAHPAFRMSTSQMLNKHLKFVATETRLIGYQLKDNANGDSWKNMLVYYNARNIAVNIKLNGDWLIAAEGESILLNGGKPAKNSIAIPPVSMLILYQP